MSGEEVIIDLDDIEQSEDPNIEPESQDETDEFDQVEYDRKLQQVRDLLNLVSEGEEPSARVSPILSPKEKRTSSKLQRGEVEMCLGLITLASISPQECYPALDYVHNKLMLNLSLDGYGIERAIELGKALTVRDATTRYIDQPEKPTDGMKDK